jgi:sugar O-acyltransferase (sialic acid O-acetyltransferase NeuD family)
MSDIILIGLGRQTKSIITAARLSGLRVRAIYDNNAAQWGQLVAGVPVVGSLALASSSRLPAVLGFDEPRLRKDSAQQLDVRWISVIHPRAFLDPSAKVGAGTIVFEGVVAQADVDLRQHVVVSANVTISHDSVVEDFVQLSPGVVLAGTVRIGQGARLEPGALVIPNIHVGAWATVGPRAVVIHDVPEKAHVEGMPATTVEEAEPAGIRHLRPETAR